MEPTPWNLASGAYTMEFTSLELTPWMLPNATYTMEVT